MQSLLKLTRLFLPIMIVISAISGCVPASYRIAEEFGRPPECQKFLDGVDEVVRKAGTSDASCIPVPGFPYLRTNRFLAALKTDLRNDAQRKAWVEWMREMDSIARRKEILNLPDASVRALMPEEKVDRGLLLSRMGTCSRALFTSDLSRKDFHERLIPVVGVPDEYSTAMRVFGLYPLAYIPENIITHNVRETIRSWFETPPEKLPVRGRLKTYAPAIRGFISEKEVRAILDVSRKNPLNIPRPEPEGERMLAVAFAPVIIQDVAASYDEIGSVAWKGKLPDVDISKPGVYYYISHAFLKKDPILQINYVFWYPERAGDRAPRIEHGRLDGLTLRISLDPEGKPFMWDVMHNCGCYHLFAPKRDRIDHIIPRAFAVDPFVPTWMPDIKEGERPVMRVMTGWHQVEGLLAAAIPGDFTLYDLTPYGELESLPREEHERVSLFDMSGIGQETDRIEPYIFFPMGIPSIGSMRQRGHHAILLSGRAHFDDPDLFNSNFTFK